MLNTEHSDCCLCLVPTVYQGHYGTFFESANNQLQVSQRRLIPCQMSTWYSLNRASLVRMQSNLCYVCEPLLRQRGSCTPSSLWWPFLYWVGCSRLSTFDKNQASSACSFQHWIKWQRHTQRTEHSFGCFNILFLASFSSLSTEFLSPNLVVMTKKLPGCDRAFSSLSPSLPFSNSCNNCRVFFLLML